MESTASAGVGQAAIPLRVGPRSLASPFTRVPDPRRVASVAYPLAAVLALAVSAILANALFELAIAPWATPTGGRPADPRSSGCSARWTGRPWRRR